jgi:flagellar biosynthetic protein FliQ
MNENLLVELLKETLYLIIKVSAPMLITSLVIGLVVSILQTVTSIQEQTLTFVPKLIAVFLVIMLFGNWIMKSIVEYFQYLADNFRYFTQG